MIRESHRDASLVDVQSRKHIIVPRDKCLASHRSASLIQWLKFQPLYRLLGTRGEPRHPSYKSQHEPKFLYHPESLSVRPEKPVEGLRESFLQLVRVGGAAELFACPLVNHLAAYDCHID